MKMPPDETILGLLAVRARHGYDLIDCFHDPTQLGEVWQLSTSQLYAVLKRLEAQGLTIGQEVIAPDAPPRIEYTLTDSGLARLRDWLNEPMPSASIHAVRVLFLSRLYIARLLNVPTVPIVERQKMTCRAKHAELLACLDRSAPGIGHLTLEFVAGQVALTLQWLDRCELTPHDEDAE